MTRRYEPNQTSGPVVECMALIPGRVLPKTIEIGTLYLGLYSED